MDENFEIDEIAESGGINGQELNFNVKEMTAHEMNIKQIDSY